jgi:hypothetical protein
MTVDRWIKDHGDTLSRPEAIRRLVEIGLRSEESKRPISNKSAAKASEMAGNALDKLQPAGSATEEERASRKRRLLKGPKEFR